MCQECNNTYPNCPVCSEDIIRDIECIECDKGRIRFDDSGSYLTKEQYDLLPDDERFEEDCVICGGTGVIQQTI